MVTQPLSRNATWDSSGVTFIAPDGRTVATMPYPKGGRVDYDLLHNTLCGPFAQTMRDAITDWIIYGTLPRAGIR